MEHRSVALAALVYLLGCGPQTMSPSDATTSASTGDAGSDASDDPSATSASATDDGPPPFEPIACERTSLTLCPAPWPDESTYFQCSADGGCESLMCDPQNCGECGHRCGGACIDAVCWSGHSECVHPEDGLSTCAEVCAVAGAECEDRLSAESGHFGCDRGYVFAGGYTPSGLPLCPSPVQTPETYVEASCDEPITWDHGTPEEPQTGIRCCCKGELP